MFFNLSFLKSVTQLIFSFFYMLVGVKHFTNPDIFLKIVPPYLTKKLELVYLSGLFEILFGRICQSQLKIITELKISLENVPPATL